MLGYAFCGSFCTHAKSLAALRQLIQDGHEVLPIMSEIVYTTGTRFGTAAELILNVETLCGRPVIHTIKDAEPLGPKINLELLIISPCTGNTLAKMASGITDTAVTMAAKAQLRSNRPLLIALASNDALSANLKNIAAMSQRKHVYFAPMEKDDPDGKPYSLVCDFTALPSQVKTILGQYK